MSHFCAAVFRGNSASKFRPVWMRSWILAHPHPACLGLPIRKAAVGCHAGWSQKKPMIFLCWKTGVGRVAPSKKVKLRHSLRCFFLKCIYTHRIQWDERYIYLFTIEIIWNVDKYSSPMDGMGYRMHWVVHDIWVKLPVEPLYGFRDLRTQVPKHGPPGGVWLSSWELKSHLTSADIRWRSGCVKHRTSCAVDGVCVCVRQRKVCLKGDGKHGDLTEFLT